MTQTVSPVRLSTGLHESEPAILCQRLSRTHTIDIREGVREIETNHRGLRFSLGAVNWLDDDHVEIIGGYYENGLSASGKNYFVSRQNGVWRVTRVEQHGVS
jgi:hypothetical protein